MSPELKNRLRLAALVLLLAMPLALLLSRVWGGLVRDLIAVPFVYLTWIARVYLGTVPRALLWGALLLFGLLVALGSMRVRGSGEGQVPIQNSHRGNVRELTSQIRFAGQSEYFKRRLAQRLGTLITKGLDYGEHYKPESVRRGLDTLDAPPKIRSFFLEGEQLIVPSRSFSLVERLQQRFQPDTTTAASDPDLEEAVRFLENRLEVS